MAIIDDGQLVQKQRNYIKMSLYKGNRHWGHVVLINIIGVMFGVFASNVVDGVFEPCPVTSNWYFLFLLLARVIKE